MARAITVIPATKNIITSIEHNAVRKRRVAAYARVSTDNDEQFTSYEAQIDYYTKYILAREDWEFVNVYTDEGISGTNTKHRKGFNDMVQDALDGKIDLIITKSVSRFARNTVDSLVTVRTLKEAGVEVFFEKENIYTFDSKGELLITIMSSLAQEESRSISENVTWGQRKRFADGKVTMPYKHFLGYKKGKDGTPEIDEEQAKIVRLIYRLFLQGRTPTWIAEHLTQNGVQTPGEKTKWRSTTILSILQNEKYKGDALLQKCYTVDFLTKKQKVNTGEVPQYYVENSHPAIVTPLEFDMVQAEIARRRELGRSYSGLHIFSSRLICADCGGFYGQKVWHSTDAWKKQIWQCNSKFKGHSKCKTATLSDESIKAMFLKAYNLLMGDRERIIEDCEEMRMLIFDCTELDNKIAALNEEIEVIAGLVDQCVRENASSAQSQEEYADKYNRLVKRYEKAVEKLKAAQAERENKLERERELRIFVAALKEQPLVLGEWSDEIWISLIDVAKVMRDGSVIFTFKNGVSIEVEG